jgi:hypothetical protein
MTCSLCFHCMDLVYTRYTHWILLSRLWNVDRQKLHFTLQIGTWLPAGSRSVKGQVQCSYLSCVTAYRGFSQSVQANVEIVTWNTRRPKLSSSPYLFSGHNKTIYNLCSWKGVVKSTKNQFIYSVHLSVHSLVCLCIQWFSKGLWQWLIHYRNTMLDIVHCLRCIWYTQRFRSWLYPVFRWLAVIKLTLFSVLLGWTQDLSNNRLVR